MNRLMKTAYVGRRHGRLEEMTPKAFFQRLVRVHGGAGVRSGRRPQAETKQNQNIKWQPPLPL